DFAPLFADNQFSQQVAGDATGVTVEEGTRKRVGSSRKRVPPLRGSSSFHHLTHCWRGGLTCGRASGAWIDPGFGLPVIPLACLKCLLIFSAPPCPGSPESPVLAFWGGCLRGRCF